MSRCRGRRGLILLCLLLWAGRVGESRGADAAAPPSDGAGTATCQGKARLRGLVFDKDGSVIDPAGAAVLDVVVDGIKKRCPTQHFVIEGHTDISGSPQHNQALSERRAEAVKSYFVAHGIAEDRLSTVGYGSSRPLTTNPSPSAQAINRRVTLVVQN
jgi:outer membrane protein OmpA-like peptidoglycan-associated protein